VVAQGLEEFRRGGEILKGERGEDIFVMERRLGGELVRR